MKRKTVDQLIGNVSSLTGDARDKATKIKNLQMARDLEMYILRCRDVDVRTLARLAELTRQATEAAIGRGSTVKVIQDTPLTDDQLKEDIVAATSKITEHKVDLDELTNERNEIMRVLLAQTDMSASQLCEMTGFPVCLARRMRREIRQGAR